MPSKNHALKFTKLAHSAGQPRWEIANRKEEIMGYIQRLSGGWILHTKFLEPMTVFTEDEINQIAAKIASLKKAEAKS